MIDNEPVSVFIRSIPSGCTLAILKNFLSQILLGDFKLKRGKSKGKNKSGHATVTVYNERDLQTLLHDTLILQGVELEIQRLKTPEELFTEVSTMLKKRIYIDNLPFQVKHSEVKSLFSKFGAIKNVFIKPKIEISEDGVERRFINSYVNFNKVEDTRKCLDAIPVFLNGHELYLYQKLTPQNKKKKSRASRYPGWSKPVSTAKFEFNKNLIKNNEAKKSKSQKSKELFPVRIAITGRGREGKYQIEPFQKSQHSYKDWIGNSIDYHLSLKSLLPFPMHAGASQRRRSNLECGYNHDIGNLRISKDL